MITPDIFKTRFSEFSTIDDTLIQLLLDEAYEFLNPPKYKDTIILYYVAHNLVVTQNQSNGNSNAIQTIASKSVGNVSVSYTSVNTNDDAYFSGTTYGQMYLKYVRAIASGNVRLV